MTGFEVATTIIMGATGISVSVLLGIFLFRNSNTQTITTMPNTIASKASDVSGFGQTLGEVKKGVEVLGRKLPIKFDEVKNESAIAHASIGKIIKKSSKKAKKQNQELKGRMNGRFDELSQKIKDLGAFRNTSITTNH